MPYLNSVLDAYEFVLQKSPTYSENTASKVKQEILHGLGNSFIQLGFLVRFYECLQIIRKNHGHNKMDRTRICRGHLCMCICSMSGAKTSFLFWTRS